MESSLRVIPGLAWASSVRALQCASLLRLKYHFDDLSLSYFYWRIHPRLRSFAGIKHAFGIFPFNTTVELIVWSYRCSVVLRPDFRIRGGTVERNTAANAKLQTGQGRLRYPSKIEHLNAYPCDIVVSYYKPQCAKNAKSFL
jgi:hypothetical protein